MELSIKSRVDSLKLSDFIEIKRPNYAYLKLIPDKSIKTYNSSIVAKMIANIHRSIQQRITKVENIWHIESPMKCSYYIDITKNDVEFVFIVPSIYENVAKEKIRAVWDKVTIEKIDGIKPFSNKKVAYQLEYKKEDALSLDVDKRSSTLLNSVLNVIDVLEDGDRVGIYYNFIPYNQYTWRSDYNKSIEKWKQGLSLSRNKMDMRYIAKVSALVLVEVLQSAINGILEVFCDSKSKPNVSIIDDLKNAMMRSGMKLSRSTLNKKENTVLNTQIAVISDGNQNNSSSELNAITVCQSFNAIAEDNELVYKKIKSKDITDFTAYKHNGIALNKLSTEECYNLIQLPGVETLKNHKINFINVLQTQVAEELRQGYVDLGESIYKGVAQRAYMSTDDNLANLGLVVLGPQGSGKSVFFSNYSKNVVNYGEGLMLIDFIGNCSLSDEIIATLDPKKVVVINLAKKRDMQSFAFNEVVNSPDNYGDDDEDDTDDKVMKIANDQAQLLVSFIDSINRETPLTGRMRRAISSACNVVFIQPNMSLRDVVSCLNDFEVRHKFIDKIPNKYKEELTEEVNTLLEMDEYDKDGEIVGTKSSKIDFVIDRISLLIEDRKLKYMYKKPMSQNLDFVKLMEEGKSIFIKIPETEYPTMAQKNILVTFFICKLWMAAKIRYSMHNGKQLRYHVVLDEIFQAPNCYGELQDILLQARKFRCKFVFSAHFLNKLGELKECIKASGSSYMFLQGTDKKNFEEMEKDLAPFVIDDLLNLKRYHSMNMIKCNNGFSKFITKLPPPIKIS